jgi:hypothetical protein
MMKIFIYRSVTSMFHCRHFLSNDSFASFIFKYYTATNKKIYAKNAMFYMPSKLCALCVKKITNPATVTQYRELLKLQSQNLHRAKSEVY